MANKKVFTNESLATFVDETKQYVDKSVAAITDNNTTYELSQNRNIIILDGSDGEATAVQTVGRNVEGESFMDSNGNNYTGGVGAEVFNYYNTSTSTYAGEPDDGGGSGNSGNTTETLFLSNIASGNYSHAEGLHTIASGASSHAEGEDTIASGNYSHAEGEHTEASWYGAHAEGTSSKASGYGSHAEGQYTKASGNSSHAEGQNTTTSGDRSHAEGLGTIASSKNQHVQGKYNTEDTQNKYAHIVGNGDSNTERSNAHTLDWSGNAWFAGDVQATDENGNTISLVELSKSGGGSSGTLEQIQVDWNETDTNSHAYIKNKPFGSVLGNDILEYVNRTGLEQSVSNTHGSFDYILHAIDNSPVLEEGKTYQVNYEGVNYVCVAKTYTSGSNAACYLGNLNYMLKINDEFDESVQDTGEPFIILYIIQDNAMMIVLYDKTNSSFNLGIKAVEINKIDPKYVDTYTKTEINELTEQALSNYYTKSEVDKKLDNFSGGSYAEQVQSDWNETNVESPAYIKNKPIISADGTAVAQSDWNINDSSDAAYIKNRPFYETTEIVEVLPLQDINIQIIDGVFQEQMILGELDNFDKEGVTYIVTYNGVEYTCVSSSYVGMIVVGNGANLGGENTGEPFIFAYDATGSMTGQGPALLIIVLETPNDGEESITRSIKIDAKIAVINHIEPKYIKDMYHTTIEPIPIFETVGFDFTLDPQYSDYGIYSCYPTTTSQIEYMSLIEGNSYNVIWDGVAYTCTAVALSLGDMSGFAIGNAALFGLGENTGEPFLIASIPDYSSNAFMTMDTSSYHAIGISTDGESVSQIDPKYLPILESTGSITLVPEQYVVAVNSSNNMYYYLLSSPTDYNTFLGLVDQIVYVTYNGKDYELPIITQNDEVGISNGDPNNTSEESFIIKKSRDGVLMLINTTGSPVTVKVSTKPTDYSIKSKYLSGVTVSGGSALPKVTEEDNGKFLRVVDGAWAIVDIGIAEEEAF